jgi:hypothetical protein
MPWVDAYSKGWERHSQSGCDRGLRQRNRAAGREGYGSGVGEGSVSPGWSTPPTGLPQSLKQMAVLLRTHVGRAFVCLVPEVPRCNGGRLFQRGKCIVVAKLTEHRSAFGDVAFTAASNTDDRTSSR